MEATCSPDTAEPEWRIQIGEVFDLDTARESLRHCREERKGRPKRMVFDLSQTRLLHTAGIGAMLYLKSTYRVGDDNAFIVYQHPEVGQILRLAHLDRSFQLREPGQTPAPRSHGGEAACV